MTATRTTRPARTTRAPAPGRGVAGWLRLFLGLGAFTAGGGAGAALVLGHIGGERWAFERLADLRPILTLLVLVAVAALLVARWRLTALLLGIVALVGAWTVAPLWLRPPAAAEPGAEELRIASLNLSRRGDVGALADHLRDTVPADVVIIVESNRDVDERFRRGDTGYDVVFPLPGEPNTQTTVLARRPVHVVGPVVLDPRRPPKAVDLEIPLGDQVVHVLGAHPRSPRGPGSAAMRNGELRRIADWARAQDGPTLVMGDLNVTRWAPAFGLVTDGAGLVDSSLGYGLQPTWRLDGARLAFPIDHLLHSPSLTTTSRRTGPSFGSDHAMVVATVAPAER